MLSTPTRVQGLPSDILEIACAQSGQTVCVRSLEQIACWGDNSEDAAGFSGASEIDAPTAIPSFPGAMGASNISLGTTFGCATNGFGIQCWGDNAEGQVGIGGELGSLVVPPQQAVGLSTGWQVSTGVQAACAWSATDVKCWGTDNDGEFGDMGASGAMDPTPTSTPALAGLHELSIGRFFGCGLNANAEAVCWGSNALGLLGRGTTSGTSLPPEAVMGISVPIGAVAAGQAQACAVAAAGSLMCWGDNSLGELGQGTTGTVEPLPLRVPVPGAVVQVALGATHLCALAADHSVWCWGANDSGQLGLGTTGAPVPSPTQVTLAR